MAIAGGILFSLFFGGSQSLQQQQQHKVVGVVVHFTVRSVSIRRQWVTLMMAAMVNRQREKKKYLNLLRSTFVRSVSFIFFSSVFVVFLAIYLLAMCRTFLDGVDGLCHKRATARARLFDGATIRFTFFFFLFVLLK